MRLEANHLLVHNGKIVVNWTFATVRRNVTPEFFYLKHLLLF